MKQAKFPTIIFLLLFGPCCGEEITLEEYEDLIVNCTADTADEFEAILWEKAWLPDGYSQIFRLHAFGPSGLKDYGSTTLRCKI